MKCFYLQFFVDRSIFCFIGDIKGQSVWIDFETPLMSAKDLMGTGNFKNLQQAEQELIKIKKSASDVQIALNKAFNANLGTTNLSRFNAELQKLNISAICFRIVDDGSDFPVSILDK